MPAKVINQSEIPGLRQKVLLDAGDKSPAATITLHLPFKDKYLHVWAKVPKSLPAQPGCLLWCIEPIRFADTLHLAWFPFLHSP